MLENLLTLIAEKDTAAAVEHLHTQADLLAAAEAYDALLHHLYEKARDVPRLILVARAGIQHGLTAAAEVEASDPALADELRGRAKTLAYNLASGLWPGWDEPGLTLNGNTARIGLDAARLNLRLARQLKRDELVLSRAYWLLGALLLASGDRPAAREEFAEAARYADKAGKRDESLLSQCYAALVAALDSPHDAGVQQRLADLLALLTAEPDGDFFVQQIETARRIFARMG